MPCCCAVAVVMGTVSALTTATTSVASLLGYSMVGAAGVSLTQSKTAEEKKLTTVQIPLETGEMTKDSQSQKVSMQFTKGDISFGINQDERGKFFINVAGKKTDKELLALGNDMKDRITQQFVYHKVVTGLKEKGYVMVGEEIEEGHTVHVLLRRFI